MTIFFSIYFGACILTDWLLSRLLTFLFNAQLKTKICQLELKGALRFGPVTGSALHFRPFSGRFGPNSLEGPKGLDVIRRFGPKIYFH